MYNLIETVKPTESDNYLHNFKRTQNSQFKEINQVSHRRHSKIEEKMKSIRENQGILQTEKIEAHQLAAI